MSRVNLLVLGLVLAMALTGCKPTPSEAVPVHRLEKVLFETPAPQLQSQLKAHADEFNTPLLTLYPDDPAFMQQLEGFVADPVIRRLYTLVDSTFGDMQQEARQLGGALARMHEAFPAMRYDKVYTYISGTFDYSNRVVCNSHECLIGIDQYILPSTEGYGYFGTQHFLVRQSQPKYLVPDVVTAMAREHIAMDDAAGDPTLLDYMVYEGKALYLASVCLPDMHDSILLRYSSGQYEWTRHHEEHIWTYFLQNKLLFENDLVHIHNFIDEAPQTNAFRGEGSTPSSPRTTEYIGLRIIRGYMKNTGATVPELFAETNAQKILSQSGYRPS